MLASSGFVDKYSKFLEEKEKEAKENGFTEQDKPSVEDTLESTEALMKLKDQKKRADRYKRKFQQIEKDFCDTGKRIMVLKKENKEKDERIKELESIIEKKDHQLELACKLLQFNNKTIVSDEKNSTDDEYEEEEEEEEEDEEDKVSSVPLGRLILTYLKNNKGRKYCSKEIKKVFADYAPKNGFHGKLSTITARLYELFKRNDIEREIQVVENRPKYTYFVPN